MSKRIARIGDSEYFAANFVSAGNIFVRGLINSSWFLRRRLVNSAAIKPEYLYHYQLHYAWLTGDFKLYRPGIMAPGA
ncbi:MAG: hypothetical protein ACLUD2_05300 [Clostridium sp.]